MHNAICYHRVTEAQAACVRCVGWISGDFNLIYLFIKTKMSDNARHNLVESIFLNTASPIGGIEKS